MVLSGARINVARNIRRAIAAIDRVAPELAAHLAVSIRTGHDEDRAVAMIDADGSNLEVVLEPEVVGTSNRPYPRLRPVSSSK